jgi:hypothetical protein
MNHELQITHLIRNAIHRESAKSIVETTISDSFVSALPLMGRVHREANGGISKNNKTDSRQMV